MDREQLIEYLKIVVDAENSLHVLRECIRKYVTEKNSLGKSIPLKKENADAAIKNVEKEKYHTPILSSGDSCSGVLFSLIGITVCALIISAIACAVAPDTLGNWFLVFIFVFLALFTFALLNVYHTNINNGEIDREHELKINAIKERINHEYEIALELDAQRVQRERQIAVHIQCKAIDPITAQIADLEATLQELYDMNIIYPTYRNMVAVNQLLEYIDSGICSRLEGENGAYAQYLLDVRTNRIVNSVNDLKEAVLNKMDAVIANQLRLCSLMQNCVTILGSIDSAVGSIGAKLDSIHNSIQESYSKQVAANDYLSTMNDNLTRIANSYDREAVEVQTLNANLRTKMLHDGISEFRLRYSA